MEHLELLLYLILITQFKCWNRTVPKGRTNILSYTQQSHMHVMSKHFSSEYFWRSRRGQRVWKSSVLVTHGKRLSEVKNLKGIVHPKMNILSLMSFQTCMTSFLLWNTKDIAMYWKPVLFGKPVRKQSLLLQFCLFFAHLCILPLNITHLYQSKKHIRNTTYIHGSAETD